MKSKPIKALAGLLALLMLTGSLSACNGESFGSRLKNLFNPGGVHDGVTTVRPPRTTVPETTTELSEMDKKMQLAPDLPGAKKVIKEINGYKRVTYVAESGNPYGVEAGTYLGEFKKKVELEGKEVGGVALIPSVAKKLLKDALGEIPEGQDKWVFFVPADITELENKDSKVEMNRVSTFVEGKEYFYIKVSFKPNTISVSNPVFSEEDGVFSNGYIVGGFGEDGVVNFLGNYVEDIEDFTPRQQSFIAASRFSKLKKYAQKTILPFGIKMAETGNSLYVGLSNGTNKIDESNLAKVDDSIIFVIDHSSVLD